MGKTTIKRQEEKSSFYSKWTQSRTLSQALTLLSVSWLRDVVKSTQLATAIELWR